MKTRISDETFDKLVNYELKINNEINVIFSLYSFTG